MQRLATFISTIAVDTTDFAVPVYTAIFDGSNKSVTGGTQ